MLLLDSQTAIWVLDDNPRLGSSARGLIERSTAVHVSAASIWELTIKSMLGKLKVPTDLTAIMREQGFELLEVTAEDAEGLREFPELVRHDPFDRLILAHAKRNQLRLLTADSVLLDLGLDFILDSRD